MLLNEDYFKDIEITDDDMEASVTGGYSDTDVFNNYLMSHYNRNIMLACFSEYEMFNEFKPLWKHTIPEMLSRIKYIFEAYNIEYECIFRDSSRCSEHASKSDINHYRVGEYDVFSYNTETSFFNSDVVKSLFINIYVRFPDFSFRDSYNFVDRFQNTLWKKNFPASCFFITK